jgi:hypothetical protein
MQARIPSEICSSVICLPDSVGMQASKSSIDLLSRVEGYLGKVGMVFVDLEAGWGQPGKDRLEVDQLQDVLNPAPEQVATMLTISFYHNIIIYSIW